MISDNMSIKDLTCDNDLISDQHITMLEAIRKTIGGLNVVIGTTIRYIRSQHMHHVAMVPNLQTVYAKYNLELLNTIYKNGNKLTMKQIRNAECKIKTRKAI